VARAYDIVTFADTAVDLLLTGADLVPRFGQAEQWVDDYAMELGGSCCLFAAQAAKLGLRVVVLGRVGADAFGELVRDKLRAAGVDTTHLTTDPALKTGLTVVLSPSGHERAMLTYGGSLRALQPNDVTDDLLASARHLHYGSLFLHTGLLPHWQSIVRRARALGLSTSLDTNWDPTERWQPALEAALPALDWLLPNEQEARLLVGQQADLPLAIETLRRAVPYLAIKQGAAGATLYHGNTICTCTPEPAASGGDSTGAGDAFDAGLLTGWLRGLPLATCLELACACGRSVASAVGGYAGQVWLAEAARWLNAQDEGASDAAY
jgi:sugar/nucleoside kinase (ribokinase family)